jgi:DNA replication and repair protein RecF
MQSAMRAPAEVPGRPVPVTLGGLHLRNFRNFAELRCEFPAAGAMITGPNGSGKTNLLEAIYYLEVFRSFRGAPDAELVRFGEDVFRIEAGLEGDPERVGIAAAYQRATRRKKVELDGREPGRISDAFGAFGAVVFHLDDAELVSGSPGHRRRYLDILLSIAEPGYLADLQRYRAVLSQRNEALRSGRTAVIDAWTPGLVGPGARLMAARSRWTAARSDDFRAYHAGVAGGAGASLRYEPGLGGRAAPGEPSAEAAGDPDPVEAWGARLARGLEAGADRDRRRGFTTVGPHRDDLEIRARLDAAEVERDLRSFGSGGQRRTAAVALRLVEADSLRDARGREPVYLLDDVFAELDRERADRVFRLLEDGRTGQVFFTAPKPSDVPLRDGGLARWRIRDGALVADG